MLSTIAFQHQKTLNFFLKDNLTVEEKQNDKVLHKSHIAYEHLSTGQQFFFSYLEKVSSGKGIAVEKCGNLNEFMCFMNECKPQKYSVAIALGHQL